MLVRMTRAAQLNVDLYEEVEHNRALDSEARTVVMIVSALSALGVILSGGGIALGVAWALLSVLQWYVWSFLTLFIGVRLFNGTADFGEISRAIAYGMTPNALRLFAFVPVLGGLLLFVAWIWSLIAGIIAVRQAMDFDTLKAIATVLIAGVIAFVPMLILEAIVGALF